MTNTRRKTRIHMFINTQWIRIMPYSSFQITSTKGKSWRLYLLKARDLTLASKIRRLPWKFLIDTSTFLRLSKFYFNFDINIPKFNNISGWLYSSRKTVEFGKEYFKYLNIIHNHVLSYAKSIIFWFTGFSSFVSSIDVMQVFS